MYRVRIFAAAVDAAEANLPGHYRCGKEDPNESSFRDIT